MISNVYLILLLILSIVFNIVAIRVISNLKYKYSGRIKRTKKEKVYITQINEKVEYNTKEIKKLKTIISNQK